MEIITLKYVPNTDTIRSIESKSEIYSYISNENEQDSCDSHYRMVHLFKKTLNQEFSFL